LGDSAWLLIIMLVLLRVRQNLSACRLLTITALFRVGYLLAGICSKNIIFGTTLYTFFGKCLKSAKIFIIIQGAVQRIAGI